MTRLTYATMSLLMLAATACSEPPASNLATGPTTTPTTCPSTMRILRDLEKAGDEFATIRSDVNYHVEMPQTGDSETRTGWVAYQKQTAEAAAKFRIRFETLRLGGGRKIRDRVDYAFDGQWLTVAKHRIRQMTKYQVAAEGEKIEPLKLGKGPFPLPFGQKADEMLEHFQLRSRPAMDKEPENSDYLKLIPRCKFRKEINFVRLEMWIDRTTHLPVKIISTDKSKNVTTVVFEDIRTNVKLQAGMFRLPRPLGWQLRVEPLRKGEKITPD